MRLRYLLFLPLFLYANLPKAQVPPIIEKLLQEKKEIPAIGGHSRGFLHDRITDGPFQESAISFTKNADGLLLNIGGTGRLYRVGIKDQALQFERMDSTQFYGNNFYSFLFSLNNRTFLLGGYGFWKDNGLLLEYQKNTKQWEALKLNKEVPGVPVESRVWLDPVKQEVYVCQYKIAHDGLHKPDSNHLELLGNSYKLNVAKGEWTLLGKITTPYYKDFSLPSPWGSLGFSRKYDLVLTDYVNNRVGHLKSTISSKLNKYYIYPTLPEVVYFSDSTMFFGGLKNNFIDSITFSINDFDFSEEKIYEPMSYLKDLRSYSWYSLIFLIPAIIFFIYRARNNKKKDGYKHIINPESKQADDQKTELLVTDVDSVISGQKTEERILSNAFSPIESDVLKLALVKIEVDYPITIEDLNKILGVAQKNDSIQKKTRSETIHAINQKYQLLAGTNAVLIDKKRSEFDKRSFEYFIRKDKVEWVKGALKD